MDPCVMCKRNVQQAENWIKCHLRKLCTGGCAERSVESGHDNRIQRMEVE